MDILENVLSALDLTLNTERKRHITGGVLLSISMFFGGLAITTLTIKEEENYDE